MKQQLHALAAAALLTVTLGSPNAFAQLIDHRNDDGKTYAGSMCQPFEQLDSDRLRYRFGGAENTFPKEAAPTFGDGLLLVCPIIKDKGGRINHGVVAVIDQRNDDSVTCNIRSHSAVENDVIRFDGPQWVAEVGTSIEDVSNRVQYLRFGAVNFPEAGYMFMECRVPPATSEDEQSRSMIVFYQVEED